jgi:hypothetical protein
VRKESQVSQPDQLADKILTGHADFNFFTESISYDIYEIEDINQSEFLTLSPNGNVVSIRSTDQQIDLLAANSLSKVA